MAEDNMSSKFEEINECARMLYELHGCEVEEGYDFSTAHHPQEKMMFAIAVKTANFWFAKRDEEQQENNKEEKAND
jgi:hypothetical protein